MRTTPESKWRSCSRQLIPGMEPGTLVIRLDNPKLRFSKSPSRQIRRLDWHQHPMINAGYVLSGEITLEKRDTRERQVIHAGQALAECVNLTHRGYTTKQPVELIVFYAGAPGLPLSIKVK